MSPSFATHSEAPLVLFSLPVCMYDNKKREREKRKSDTVWAFSFFIPTHTQWDYYCVSLCVCSRQCFRCKMMDTIAEHVQRSWRYGFTFSCCLSLSLSLLIKTRTRTKRKRRRCKSSSRTKRDECLKGTKRLGMVPRRINILDMLIWWILWSPCVGERNFEISTKKIFEYVRRCFSFCLPHTTFNTQPRTHTGSMRNAFKRQCNSNFIYLYWWTTKCISCIQTYRRTLCEQTRCVRRGHKFSWNLPKDLTKRS